MRGRRARHPAGQVCEGAVVGGLHEPEEGRGEAQEEVGEGVVHGPEEAALPRLSRALRSQDRRLTFR
jgi:hypothetical protein